MSEICPECEMNHHTDVLRKNDVQERIRELRRENKALKKAHKEIMDEIHRLRSLEDSDEAAIEVFAKLLLGLNKLCGN